MGMQLYAGKVAVAVGILLEEAAQEIEQQMKAEAPWTDQTGAAREGLTAEVYHTAVRYGLRLYYTVDYGIWLEIAHNGEYAIIQPTMEEWGPKLMALLGAEIHTTMRSGRASFI
jgi:hypothetical protein